MQLQLPCHGSWDPHLFSPNFLVKGGSQVWRHVAQLWKMMARMSTFFSIMLIGNFGTFRSKLSTEASILVSLWMGVLFYVRNV
jgi:hypothetical protein